MRPALLLLLVAAPTTAWAQPRPDIMPPGITVSGSATIKTAPDMATISFALRGEGATPDAASTDLAARQRAVTGGLARLDPHVQINTGSVSTSEVRKGDCADAPASARAEMALALSDNEFDELKKGPCRITGYVAGIEATAELASVKDAGTAIGLAQRLGASSASLDGFALRDPDAATHAAVDAAIADARAQAEALAKGAGARLGRLVSILGAPDREPAMQALNVYDVPSPPAEVMAPPVVIDVTPKPIETSAHIVLVYALAD